MEKADNGAETLAAGLGVPVSEVVDAAGKGILRRAAFHRKLDGLKRAGSAAEREAVAAEYDRECRKIFGSDNY